MRILHAVTDTDAGGQVDDRREFIVREDRLQGFEIFDIYLVKDEIRISLQLF